MILTPYTNARQDEKGQPAGSVEVALELVPTPAPAFAEDEDKEVDDSHAPTSTDNLDWAKMAAQVTKQRAAALFAMHNTSLYINVFMSTCMRTGDQRVARAAEVPHGHLLLQ